MKTNFLMVGGMLGLAFLAGCGSKGPTLYPVQGKVTQGGKPLANVNVTFAPVTTGGAKAESPGSAGRTNSNGDYVLLSSTGRAGAAAGKHKVLVSAADPVAASGAKFEDYREQMAKSRGAASAAPGAKGDPSKAAPSGSAAEAQATIPKEYSDPKTTPLEFEVKPSSNTFDIPLP